MTVLEIFINDEDLKQMDMVLADVYKSLAPKQNDRHFRKNVNFILNDYVHAEWNDSFGCFKKLILVKPLIKTLWLFHVENWQFS